MAAPDGRCVGRIMYNNTNIVIYCHRYKQEKKWSNSTTFLVKQNIIVFQHTFGFYLKNPKATA